MTHADREGEIVEAFCLLLSKLEGRTVRIVERPDLDHPGRSACDAIIDRGGQTVAVEHTRVNSFQDQKGDDARFNRVVGPLESALAAEFPEAWIEIVVPTRAVPNRTNWEHLTRDLLAGCIHAIRAMPAHEEKFEWVRVEDVPFRVGIRWQPTGRDPGCYVMRTRPPQQREELEDDMVRVIRRKSSQLAPYRSKGRPTILIIESDDIALVNHHILAEAFQKACLREDAGGLDDVFLAEADRGPSPWFYPVKIGARLHPVLPEFDDYFHAQYRLAYGHALAESPTSRTG